MNCPYKWTNSTDEEVYTHSLVASTIFWCTYTANHTSLILMCVTHVHGPRVSAVRMSSSLCHLIFSLLIFHPSLLLLFLDGHFESFSDLDDLTDVSVCDAVFRSVLMMILFLRHKAKKACNRETVARQRKKEEREGFVISVAKSMSMKSQRNSIRSHSLATQREFDSDEPISSRTPGTKSSTIYSW